MGITGYFIGRAKENKIASAVLILYLAACISSFIYFIVTGGGVNSITVSLSYILFLFIPYVAEYLMKFRCPEPYVVIVFLSAFFAFLGEAYNLYILFPPLDVILHFTDGFIFACFGFTAATFFLDPKESRKNLVGCLIAGLLTGIFVSAVWEFYEYIRSALTGMDHEEDVFINAIRSFTLSGTHDSPLVLDDITKTVIYYNGGADTYEIAGYLDIGLSDTVTDMMAGALGSAAAFAVGFIRKDGRNVFIEKLFPRLCRYEGAGKGGDAGC